MEPQTTLVRRVAFAICQSKTCEGINCCQWPANMGRTQCNAKLGAYDDAARAAIMTIHDDISALIVSGPLQGNGCDEHAERNGIIRACNHIFFSSSAIGATPTNTLEKLEDV